MYVVGHKVGRNKKGQNSTGHESMPESHSCMQESRL